MCKNVIEKYLLNYAENEINYIPKLTNQYDEVISIPCYNEFTEIIELLETNLPRVINNQKVLVILNVNASLDSKAEFIETNLKFIEYLKAKSNLDNKDIISFSKFNNYDILLIDRTSENRLFDKKSGVGLARKIGADIALKLFSQGYIKSNWIRTTDADVILSDNYLDISPDKKFSAITYTFYHNIKGSLEKGLIQYATTETALTLYEIYLRYYYFGLIYANSNYSFHTVGSSMAISANHYAQVRGFPSKREAAEDFYMLNKLAKVGKIYKDKESIINIKCRESERVPFGTGASMAKITNMLNLQQEYLIYNPNVFDYIKNINKVFNIFSENMTFDSIESLVIEYDLKNIFDEFKIIDVLETSLKMSNDSKNLLRHINTWFDAFKTLKVINYLSRNNQQMCVWSEALFKAPFLSKIDLTKSLFEIKNDLFNLEIGIS